MLGLRKVRSLVDSVFFTLQHIKEKREFNVETDFIFVDYIKTFDRVNRRNLWIILKERGFPFHLIEIIQSMYRDKYMYSTQERQNR
jgi:hypothetical protein